MDGESTKVACPSCNKKFAIKSILLHIKKSRDNCEEKITTDQYDYILSLTKKAKGEQVRLDQAKQVLDLFEQNYAKIPRILLIIFLSVFCFVFEVAVNSVPPLTVTVDKVPSRIFERGITLK